MFRPIRKRQNLLLDMKFANYRNFSFDCKTCPERETVFDEISRRVGIEIYFSAGPAALDAVWAVLIDEQRFLTASRDLHKFQLDFGGSLN